MNVKLKYISIYLNIICMYFGRSSGYVILDENTSDARVKRQAGYVYDKPTVSFDLPTATSIATQAPTVNRIQMQMYYAYPVPASGDTIDGGQQITGSSGSTTAVSSGATGYNYEVQNTQAVDTRSQTLTETQNTVNSGYQNTAVTGTQSIVTTGSTGYGDGRPVAVSNSGATGGSVSTSAPRYLPPQASEESTGVKVTTTNQVDTGLTVSKPSDTYIPQTVQVASPQNDQTVSTQSVTNAPSPSANPNTGYLLPSPQPAPKVSVQPGPVQTVPSMPTQQYLPPIEPTAGQKTVQGPIVTPAATYLPPVF